MRLPLDHNFPEPIVDCLKPWMGSTELLIRKSAVVGVWLVYGTYEH